MQNIRRSLMASAVLMVACGARSAMAYDYNIVDTGQSTFYNNTTSITEPAAGQAFYGQDAQYQGNQPSYTTSSDALTVLDNVSGLVWTQSADWNGDGSIDADDKFTYSEFEGQVDVLNAQNYGGYSDWRVPSTKELYSLIDYRGADPNPLAGASAGNTPFIDTEVFDFAYGDTSAGERFIDSQWATNTLSGAYVMGDQVAMFGVNFADGRIKGYPAFDGPGGTLKTFYARFVRGNEAYGTNDFVDNSDGTVSDEATGLMWAQDDSGEGMDWESALAWAEQMNDENYLGHNDWRLPNAKELQSLVDYSRSPDTTDSAAIDPVFDSTEIVNEAGEADYAFYWSSTTFANYTGSADNAVYVCFGRGLGSMDDVNVIDVHGAGAQRSDPKTGDEDDYPTWGFAPQGDVVRVFNFVRLVRDITDLPGDFNSDGVVNLADYTVWRNGLGVTYTESDYETWHANFGQTFESSGTSYQAASVPEPSSWAIALLAAAIGGLFLRRV